jgi:hypothetical protein
MGGAWGFVEVAMAVGFAVAGLYLAASRRPAPASPELPVPGAPGSIALDEALLLRAPESLGALLASMERWVVDGAAGAAATLARAGAWVLATADVHLVSTPADAVAARLVRLRRRVEPVVGVPLGRVVLGLLAAAALAVLLHAISPGR